MDGPLAVALFGAVTMAITRGDWAPSGLAGGAPNLDDFGGNRDEKDHLDDVGVC